MLSTAVVLYNAEEKRGEPSAKSLRIEWHKKSGNLFLCQQSFSRMAGLHKYRQKEKKRTIQKGLGGILYLQLVKGTL